MFWYILLLLVLIYLFVFLTNYLKQIKIGDAEPNPQDYWKYTYDIPDKKEFSKPISMDNMTFTGVKKDALFIENKKKFKNKLVNCYWALVIIIFHLSLYIIAGFLG